MPQIVTEIVARANLDYAAAIGKKDALKQVCLDRSKGLCINDVRLPGERGEKLVVVPSLQLSGA